MLACLSVTLCMKGATVRSFQAGLADRGRSPRGDHDRGGLPGRAGRGRRAAAARGVDRRAGRSRPPRRRPPSSRRRPHDIGGALAAASAAASRAVAPRAAGPDGGAGRLLHGRRPAAVRPGGRGRSAACARTKAYPVLVAAALGASLTDAACASAGVADMTAAQRTSIGTNPPQLDALAPDDSLVVLTLGGDDIGFDERARRVHGALLHRPVGQPLPRALRQRRPRPAGRPGQGRGPEDVRHHGGRRRPRPGGADRRGRLSGLVPGQRRFLSKPCRSPTATSPTCVASNCS